MGAATCSGSDPDRPNKVNQDGYFVVVVPSALDPTSNQRPSWIAIGVMDGHGIKGHELVRFLQTRLPVRLQEYMAKAATTTTTTFECTTDDIDLEFQEVMERQKQDLIALAHADPPELNTSTTTFTEEENDTWTTRRIENALRNAFVAAHLDARQDPTIPSGRSGTTCAVALIVPNEASNESIDVYTAVVGDSRIFVASRTVHSDNNGTNRNASWSVQPWTETTTTNNPSERTRIKKSEGRIDGNGNVFYGPVGIAMTRSLGNAVMIRAGVIPIPIIQKWTLPLNNAATTTHYICAVTDGVCDVLTQEQVMDMIQNSMNPSPPDENGVTTLDDLTQQICETSKKAWLADLPIEPKVDDMTCVLLKCSLPVHSQ
jgi:serine/threonine protein phosphatase PrpC